MLKTYAHFLFCRVYIYCKSLIVMGKDYSGTKFFYTEPLFLNKAHSTKWKAFNNKTLYKYILGKKESVHRSLAQAMVSPLRLVCGST